MKNTAKRTRAKLGCDISPDTRHKLIACLEIAPDGAYITDLEGVFLYGNKQSEELTGYKKEELVGKSYSEANLLPQKYLAKVAELLSINTTGEPAGPDELGMIRKDGKHIWVEVSTIPVKQRDGISVIIFVHDISELKRTEEALQFSNIAFNSLQEGVITTDSELTITYWNEVSEQIYGIGASEAIGRNLFDIIEILEPPPAELARIEKKLLTDGYAREEHLVRTKHKKDIWVGLSIQVIRDGDSKIIGIMTVVNDITERKKLEEELRFSDTAFRSIQEGVVATDNEYIITHWNKVSEKIYGIKASEAIGKGLFDVIEIVENSPGEVEEIFKKVEADGFCQGEWLNRTKKADVWVKISVQAIESNGKRHGWVTLITDITERKKAEELEKQLRNELDVSSRLALIGEMASGIAHEINNPLTGVIGFAQLLMNQDVPDDIKEGLKVINHEAQRVAKIVSGLLTFAHQRKPGQESVNVNELILEVLKLRSYEMEVHNIKAATKLAPDLPSTIADGSQLQQVFLNIVINAEQIMTEAHGGGKLYIKTERLNNSIRISFTDDGPGISKENLDKIFHPFFTTKGVGKGTGLGLSVCHGIITRHNGKIYAKSEPGRGATFVVELPAAADTKPEGDSKTNGGKALNMEGTTILVVDDERAILTFLNRLLSEWGYEVKTVDNATDALERLKTESYSAILLDIKMPKMSGIELYQNIKEVYPALAQRVMFITGDVLEKTTNDFLTKNKVPNITKPIDIDKLNENINRILGGKPAQSKTR